MNFDMYLMSLLTDTDKTLYTSEYVIFCAVASCNVVGG
jgi:hypothetical protein